MQLPCGNVAKVIDCYFVTGFCHGFAPQWYFDLEEFLMKMISSFLAVAMLSTSVTVSTAVVFPGKAEAASKAYCRSYAERKASRKTDKRVVRNVILGGVVGGLLGSAIGGRRTTVIGAAGGAATGIAVGGSKWNKYYADYYAFCRSEL